MLLCKWFSVWRGRFFSLNLDSLLTVACSVTGVGFKNFSGKHPHSKG